MTEYAICWTTQVTEHYKITFSIEDIIGDDVVQAIKAGDLSDPGLISFLASEEESNNLNTVTVEERDVDSITKKGAWR